MENDSNVSLRGYDFVVIRGISAKNGKPYELVKINRGLAFNKSFAANVLSKGAECVDLTTDETTD